MRVSIRCKQSKRVWNKGLHAARQPKHRSKISVAHKYWSNPVEDIAVRSLAISSLHQRFVRPLRYSHPERHCMTVIDRSCQETPIKMSLTYAHSRSDLCADVYKKQHHCSLQYWHFKLAFVLGDTRKPTTT